MKNPAGRSVDGIAGATTPAKHHSVAKAKAPAARIVKVPSAIINPDFRESNPTVKGFIGASYPSPQSALPARGFGRRMVTRGPVGGDGVDGQSQR